LLVPLLLVQLLPVALRHQNHLMLLVLIQLLLVRFLQLEHSNLQEH
jgi:hypothetical protein